MYAFSSTSPATTPSAPTPMDTDGEVHTTTVPRYHTVRRGDSLGALANRYHTSVTHLKKLNGLRGTTIHAGQKLTVGSMTKAVTAKTPTRTTQPAPEYIYYEVQPGDTLYNIAERYPGVTVDDLRRMNEELEQGGLQPGRKIKVGLQAG